MIDTRKLNHEILFGLIFIKIKQKERKIEIFEMKKKIIGVELNL